MFPFIAPESVFEAVEMAVVFFSLLAAMLGCWSRGKPDRLGARRVDAAAIARTVHIPDPDPTAYDRRLGDAAATDRNRRD